jgi:hypothetical protein
MTNPTSRAYYAFILISSIILSSGFSAVAMAAMGGGGSQICESCGMPVDSVSQAHLKVADVNGTLHYTDCLKCAFKLLPKYGELNIVATCDWNGPTYPITIALKDGVDTVTVNPSTAQFIDGNCMKNRVLYNDAAVAAIFANNGTSPYLAALQNVTIPSNATVMTVAQAAMTYAFTDSPLPSPTATTIETVAPTSPTTTNSPPKPSSTATATATTSPTLKTETCEACGMEVTPASQLKYQIIDGNGTIHFAECSMCTLRLLSKYNQVTVNTYCDWYGPNYPITVESSQFGKVVNVTPSTALFLNGGSCAANRVAYNQTAADKLLASGYSVEYTLPDQQYALPANTNVASVREAALSLAENVAPTDTQNSNLIIVAAVAGIVILTLAVVAFKKLKR